MSPFLAGCTWLLVFQCIGEAVVRLAGLPIPGGLRIRDWPARGFALGLAAHGIGTARAFQVNPDAGAFAGLAFALHGLLAAVVVPIAYVAWSALAR
jgi:putative effector of murein hydrolase